MHYWADHGTHTCLKRPIFLLHPVLSDVCWEQAYCAKDIQSYSFYYCLRPPSKLLGIKFLLRFAGLDLLVSMDMLTSSANHNHHNLYLHTISDTITLSRFLFLGLISFGQENEYDSIPKIYWKTTWHFVSFAIFHQYGWAFVLHGYPSLKLRTIMRAMVRLIKNIVIKLAFCI